jgi:signal transduction histidine kinase
MLIPEFPKSLKKHLFEALLVLGFFLLPVQIFCQPESTIDSLILVYEKTNKTDTVSLELLRTISFKSKNNEIRIKYAKELVERAEALQHNIYIHRGHLQLGQALKKSGNLSEATAHLFKSAQFARRGNYLKGEAGAYIALAGVYTVNKNYSNSQNYFNKAIKILRVLNDSTTLATALLNSGDNLYNDENLDSALIYLSESETIFRNINLNIGIAYSMGNIGLVYAKKNKVERAQTHLKQAIDILADEGEYYPIIVYNISMADIYAEQDRIDAAIKLVEDNLQIAINNGLKEQIRDANLKLSELYNQKDNLEKAFYHQSQYLVYRDSINNEETIRKMADLRADYEIGQKQAEVDLLEEQQKRQNIVFIGLLVIIALLVIMVFLYYRNYKRKQALNMIITERKEEAEAQRDQLEAINETKEKFLSIISHDLLGPVNSFKGLSTIMQASIEQQNVADLKQIHKLFDDSVENLSTLLTNLLDWSVTQQGAIPYNPEEINVAELVNELLHLFSNMALNKDINLSSTVGDKILVWADVNSLKTILRNLTSNAIKFTDQGGQITISAILHDDKVGIQVTDSGVGMAQEKIDELLAKDNFKRSSGTKGEKGVGLGLQLVKEFTEMNKGSMSIESTEEVGTKITVYLPVV